MAYRLRSTIVKSMEQIEDARERLSRLAADNNLADITAITQLINGLGNSSVPQIDAFILRAETTVSIMEDTLVLLRAEKRRKEAASKVRMCFKYFSIIIITLNLYYNVGLAI